MNVIKIVFRIVAAGWTGHPPAALRGSSLRQHRHHHTSSSRRRNVRQQPTHRRDNSIAARSSGSLRPSPTLPLHRSYAWRGDVIVASDTSASFYTASYHSRVVEAETARSPSTCPNSRSTCSRKNASHERKCSQPTERSCCGGCRSTPGQPRVSG